MPSPSRRRLTEAMALTLGAQVMVSAFTAGAQGQSSKPTPAIEGEALARKLCSACHLMSGASSPATTAGIPSLSAIANRRGQTATSIANALVKPHAPMPDIQLTRQEIQDILAYLETLRTDTSVPPLSPPDSPDVKPTYPKPT
jgi:cytochrome c